MMDLKWKRLLNAERPSWVASVFSRLKELEYIIDYNTKTKTFNVCEYTITGVELFNVGNFGVDNLDDVLLWIQNRNKKHKEHNVKDSKCEIDAIEKRLKVIDANFPSQ